MKDEFKDVLTLLKTDENVTLKTGNRIYHSANYKLDESYIQSTQKFGLEPVSMNFAQAEQSATKINEWVKEQTNYKIQNVIAPGSITALTRMVLINAIYFQGTVHILRKHL